MTIATTCLDIAIDHRIKRLIGPVTLRPGPSEGKHVANVRELGEIMKVPEPEIDVTAELAGPSSTGGIALALQQPRSEHPFTSGTRAVIDDCDTLAAFRELFAVVSRGTIDMQRDVSVFDLLPYIPEDLMNRSSEKTLATVFQNSVLAFCEKEPDVVLCAGKIWLPKVEGLDKWEAKKAESAIKGEAWKLENLGIGRTFDKYPVVRLKNNTREWTKIRRVNGFHPSYALNYSSDYSRLRQLLILNVAEVCGVYCSDWKEEAWMSGFRTSCSDLSAKLNKGRKRMYITHFAASYVHVMNDMKKTIVWIARSGQDVGDYDGLLDSRLSEYCNDASLILGELSRLKGKGWPASYTKTNTGALARVAERTLYVASGTYDQAGWLGTPALKRGVNDMLKRIERAVSRTDDGGIEINLDQAKAHFLALACQIESLLGALLSRDLARSAEAASSRGDDPLAAQVEALTLRA